ncbi:N/A [soil metagenome]
MTQRVLPAGYVRVSAGRSSVVARHDLADDARALLADGSLYEAAARDLAARTLKGRGTAYAIALPVSGLRVVVRRNRHGGLFASLTRDVFLPPTRAPYELGAALRLAAAGVRTPALVMYGIDRAYVALRRADVVTEEILGGADLATYMQPGVTTPRRDDAWAAAITLVHALDAAGARHHDLNVKNILLAPRDGALEAWVLDVDRVRFGTPHASAISRGNAARLLRSARKWRDERGAVFDEHDAAALVEPPGFPG